MRTILITLRQLSGIVPTDRSHRLASSVIRVFFQEKPAQITVTVLCDHITELAVTSAAPGVGGRESGSNPRGHQGPPAIRGDPPAADAGRHSSAPLLTPSALSGSKNKKSYFGVLSRNPGSYARRP